MVLNKLRRQPTKPRGTFSLLYRPRQSALLELNAFLDAVGGTGFGACTGILPTADHGVHDR